MEFLRGCTCYQFWMDEHLSAQKDSDTDFDVECLTIFLTIHLNEPFDRFEAGYGTRY